MDYQLAKKLKDEGYPQEGLGGNFTSVNDDGKPGGEEVYIPTEKEIVARIWIELKGH
jgi:hypothetical protein